MQVRLLPSLIIASFCGTLLSCDPCDNLDCLSSSYYAQFRIISKMDGKDLVFGPNAVYDPTKIKFYSLNGADSNFFQYTTTRFPGSNYDSILYVKFYPETMTDVYVKLSDADTDTMAITYNTFKTKCCGTITEITNFRYNDLFNLPGNRGTQEIRK